MVPVQKSCTSSISLYIYRLTLISIRHTGVTENGKSKSIRACCTPALPRRGVQQVFFNPLLVLQRDTTESESPRTVEQQLSLDDMIEQCIGDCRWTQFFQATLASFACFFDAQQSFISIFTDAEPTWHCTSPSNSPCKNICQIPRDSWNWDLPAHTSIISEWSLECSGSIITGLLASSFFLGCRVGGFVLATLADSSLGRKNMLVLSCLLMSLTGILTTFSINVWMYPALRFISGFGKSIIVTCALVLSTEPVGKKWRGKVGVIGFVCFPLGFLSLPGIAYLTRGSSWRFLYLWTCVPSVLYSILLNFLVCESPRWLYIKGRHKEFAKTLRRIAAPANLINLTDSFFDRCINWEDELQLETNFYSTIKTLMQKSWAFRRLASVMVVGFGAGMIYYGMPLGLGNLTFDLYWSVALNAFIEFPASLLIFFLIGRLNRKISVIGLALMSGICSVTCALVRRKGLQIGLELLSFFRTVTTFNVVFIYTLELFPTCVRNSAVSMLRQAALFGGLLGPIMAAMKNYTAKSNK